MRNLLISVTLGAMLAVSQTSVMAQSAGGPAEGSRAYCEAKWNAQAGAHTESYDAFMDKCMNCEAKWDDMVATNTTEGQDRSEYLKKCSKGAWWGGSYWLPGLAALGLAAGLIYVATENNHHNPVSP